MEIAVRGRDPHLARVGRGNEHRIQFFPHDLPDIGRRLGRRRLAGLGAHEFRHRRTAVGDAAARQSECHPCNQNCLNDGPPHSVNFTRRRLKLRGAAVNSRIQAINYC